MIVVHADHVVVGDGDPVTDGAVVLQDDGTVEDVGSASLVLPRAGTSAGPVVRVHGVVMPGLVNAHTHLELSALRGRVTGGRGFVPWLDALLAARLEVDPESDGAAIERAVADLHAAGTVAVGEVTNSLATVSALARRKIGGAIFHEVFGVDRTAILARVRGLEDEVAERIGAWPSSDLAYAPAIHTLYTTHVDAVREVLLQVKERALRTTLHLAEHAAERRALEHGDGPITDWLVRRVKHGAKIAWPGLSPVAFADSLGALAPEVLLVHLTDARRDELDLVAARGAPVVLCPRSNIFIETRCPPLLAALAAGVEPALGTDSLASNASLDVLAEARALADRFSSVPAKDLLRMATWNGARVLGRPDLGRIVKGSRPGLLAIDAAPSGGPAVTAPRFADPCAFVLSNLRSPRRWIVQR
jgi:cytosine/adenosine deaminase-related metal-dependent hydrolase